MQVVRLRAMIAFMSRETVNAICQTLPGASVSDPWGDGHDAWKVGGKLFATIGARGDGVAVKCASIEQAQHLEDMFGWPKAPYFHRSWVHIPLDTEADELMFRIRASYDIICAGLPAKVRKAFAPK